MAEHARTAGVALLVALPLLLPFGSAAELPLALGALAGLVLAARRELDLRAPALRLGALLFAAYWLPEFVSAFDSVAPRKSWTEVALDLRFLPFMAFALWTLNSAQRVRQAATGVAAVLALWCVDALLQAVTGWSLGGQSQGDRLSGIFGDDNLKLGGAVAALAPFGVQEAWRRGGGAAALGAFVILLAVVLLAGARAAWISLAVGLALWLWQRLGARRAALALAAAALLAGAGGVVAYQASERFAVRVERTARALSGDARDLDYALAGRLPIWRTALAAGSAHPFNGVGVRAFRYAYPAHAAPDDPWLQEVPGQGALHAHHWLLEVFSETGLFGILCWLGGLAAAWHAWRRASPAARALALAPMAALAAQFFPINTHYAVYSAFWSLLLWLLTALALAGLHAREAPSSVGTQDGPSAA